MKRFVLGALVAMTLLYTVLPEAPGAVVYRRRSYQVPRRSYVYQRSSYRVPRRSYVYQRPSYQPRYYYRAYPYYSGWYGNPYYIPPRYYYRARGYYGSPAPYYYAPAYGWGAGVTMWW